MDVYSFWQAVLAQDEGAMRGYFHPDAQVDWPCTNERFTLEEYLRANCRYPGDWDGEVERVVERGELVITVTRVWPRDRSASFHVTSFLRLRGDRIAQMEEYWADDGPPPRWRREMGIGRPIR